MKVGNLDIFDVGMLGYPEALCLQQELLGRVRAGLLISALVIASHPPVITLGRNAKKEHITAPAGELARRNIQVFPCQRGGDVTYHGPGQLVLYPIIDLRRFKQDLHWFLRSLETWTIGVLAEAGIAASARPGLTGVWVGLKKIASIGIAVREWVTFHGMALCVNSADLENFSLIRACGLDYRMTSVEQQESPADMGMLKNIFIRRCPYV